MALLSSPYRASRAGSASPLPPPPPPKAIDLNSSTRSTDRETGHKITRRAFHCDLILEDDTPETLDLVALIGEPIEPISCLPAPTAARPSTPPPETSSPQKQDEKRYASLVEELVKTEKSYLSRLRALKINYADPLREFAKDRNTQIIPLYEAKNLFSNIDQVVNASAAFLSDLEAMANAGEIYSVADICLRHVSIPRARLMIAGRAANVCAVQGVSRQAGRGAKVVSRDVEEACRVWDVYRCEYYCRYKLTEEHQISYPGDRQYRPARAAHGTRPADPAVYPSLVHHGQMSGTNVADQVQTATGSASGVADSRM